MSSFADAPTSNPTNPLLSATLTWNPSGSSNNNGNLWNATYSHGGPGYPTPLTFTDSFTYDPVNRLQTAIDSGGWSRSFAYDAYGNMTPTANPAPPTVSFNADNQINGLPYDQTGNQLKVNGNATAYDFENRVTTETDGVTGAIENYIYDGDGHRVEQYGATPTTVFVYDAMGQLAAEYSTAATSSPCGAFCYLTTDHLGSTRLVTDTSGNVVARHDYLPFGEEVAASTFGRDTSWNPGTDFVNQKFTGKERDAAGLDYFGARYFGSALGRWTSPDSVNLNDDRLMNPSSTMNKYAYGGNNPLKYVDPDGEDITLFYTNGGPAGHAMLLAYNQQTGDSAVQSFGPASHSDLTELKMAVGMPVPGTANYGFAEIKSADQLRQDYSSVTIQKSPEETQKVIQYIRTHSDGDYDVYTNNCTTTCAKILRDLKLHPWGEIVPQALFSNLANQYSQTKFNKPSDVAQHGRDYGNPRKGYDPFDLLFLSIRATNCHTTTARWYENGKYTGTTTSTSCY